MPSRRRWGGRKWLMFAAVAAALVLLVAGVFRSHLSAKAERLVLERLADRGLHLSYQSRGWLPWRGLTFRDVTLARKANAAVPTMALSNLSAELSWGEIWNDRALNSRWHTNDATLTLYDEQGPVVIEHVTADVQVTAQTATVARLAVQRGPIALSVTGEVRLPERGPRDDSASPPPTSAKMLPDIDLSGLRKALAALAAEGKRKSVRLQGSGTLDLRSRPVQWRIHLAGGGEGFQWRGIPWESVEGEVTATDTGLESTAAAVVRSGRIEATLDRKTGHPLNFAGQARDVRGNSSRFKGQWVSSDQTLRVSQVEGDADWRALAEALPIKKPVLPASVVVDHFPGMTLKDVVWDRRLSGAAAWSVGSVQLTSPAAISIMIKGHPVVLRNLTGSADFDGQRWRLRSVRTEGWGGTVEGQGVWSAGRLTDATIEASSIQMQHLTPWLGKAGSRLESGDVSLQYRGNLGTRSDLLTGRGSVRMTNAPLVEIPLLEPTYRFFSAAVPSGPADDQAGSMEAGFVADRGVLRIDSFQAQSDAVTVTATGTIDLPRQRVDARARGELRGVAGWATQPLSHALEMEITGPLSNPHVSAQGPAGIAGGLVRGTAESAVEAVKIPANIIEGAFSLPQRIWQSLTRDKRSAP